MNPLSPGTLQLHIVPRLGVGSCEILPVHLNMTIEMAIATILFVLTFLGETLKF